MCKNQGPVSHPLSEAEVIALDTGLRLDCIPALCLQEDVINTLCPRSTKSGKTAENCLNDRGSGLHAYLSNIDYVPPSLPAPAARAKLILLEANEPVIGATIKRRSPHLRSVARTQRVDLDWHFDRVSEDLGISI
eukprot:6300673-Karenia_brevis.AAC.1